MVPFSALNDELRYEAEFFRKRYLAEDSCLARLTKFNLGTFATITDGPHGYHEVDDASPVAMLTARSVSDWFSNRDGADRIAKWVDVANMRSRLRARDVVLSTRGTVGMCALVVDESLPANLDQDVARISWRDEEAFIPEFVVAYLNTRFGQDHIARHASGMVQQGLSLRKVREIPIPRLGLDIQIAIAQTVNHALEMRRSAEKFAQDADAALTTALGLREWQPPEPLAYTRRAIDVFAASRLDSQYFTPRVAELLAHLGKGGRTVSDVASPRQERFPARGSGNFCYIEISDVRSDGTVTSTVLPIRDAPSRAAFYVREGDVLTSTVRPNRRLSAVVTQEQDGCVASSGFLVLQPQAVPAEVLLTYLRLPLVCELMDLHTSASLYPAISDRDLLALPFPEISETTIKSIVAAIRGAHMARKQASTLLLASKRAVEIAIEASEAKALAYLRSQGT